ncbi:MAG: hypothetical protein ACYDCH_14195 [Gaiellaceae bacterium]
MRTGAVAALAALALLAAGCGGGRGAAAPAGAGGTQRPWLWQCEAIHPGAGQDTCYERLLLQDIDRSGDPATELPRIDRRALAAGTSLYGRCHLLMHTVGREWAAQHHLTIEQLQNVEPRSNDPGCSAGFGMGLVMYLGPEIISTGGRSVIPECNALPTRYRRFTCVHSLGHALMRGYHDTLFLAVGACAKLGPRYAPDCEQGAFHDYWISLRGADDTTSPVHAVRSPRKLCAQYARWAVECWYRYFIEQAPGPIVQSAHDLTSLCAGLAGGQRAGCIAGAAKDDVDDPVAQTQLCEHLRAAADALACLRGVANQVYVGQPAKQLALFRQCARMPAGARTGCDAWFGRTFNVVTNGTFLAGGCPKLATADRAACETGARAWNAPLVTFS